MSIELLGALRSEQQRQEAPAVRAMNQYRGDRESDAWCKKLLGESGLRRRIGILRQMLRVTRQIRDVHATALILAGGGHKFQEIRSELAQADFPRTHMRLLKKKVEGPRFVGLLLGRYMLFRNLIDCIYLHFRTKGKLARYFDVTCLYAVFSRELSRLPGTYWLVIGDLSIQRIALAAAARVADHKIISWQSDYLDFKRFPVKPDIAVVLNGSGLKLARMTEADSAQGKVLWTRPIERHPVQLERLSEKPVGVLLNAFADQQVLNEQLVDVYEALDRPVHLRLHPRSSLHKCDVPDGIVLRPAGETLEEFVGSVGVVVCGNTSAQFKALCLGAPIVQVPGLDPMPFDHHGYVSEGLVLGAQEIANLSIESARSFYLKRAFEHKIEEVLGLRAQAKRAPLSRLAELVTLQ